MKLPPLMDTLSNGACRFKHRYGGSNYKERGLLSYPLILFLNLVFEYSSSDYCSYTLCALARYSSPEEESRRKVMW